MRRDIGEYLRQLRTGQKKTFISLGYAIETYMAKRRGGARLAGSTIAERYLPRFEHEEKELAKALNNEPPDSEVLIALIRALDLTSEQYNHLLGMIGPAQRIYNRLASQAIARVYTPGEQLRKLPDHMRLPLERLINEYYRLQEKDQSKDWRRY